MKGLLADAVDVDEDLRNEISKTKETIEDNLAQIEMAEENERIEAEEQENLSMEDFSPWGAFTIYVDMR